MWIRFLADDFAYLPMQWAWMDPLLVALSVVMSLCSAILAMHLVGVAQTLAKGTARNWWAMCASLCLGGGAWAMHFVGMQAFTPCATGQLSALHSALSVLPSVLAAGWLVHTLLQANAAWHRVLIAGVVLGLGVAVMHFWGMHASEAARYIDYAPMGLVMAAALGLSMSVFAVVVYRRMRDIGARTSLTTLLSGGTMGLATAGMHYIAMDAIHLAVGPDTDSSSPAESHWTLLTISAAFCLLLGLMILGLSIALRWRQLYAQTQRSEARLRAVVDTAVDAIIMIESDGTIAAFNPAAERLVGWREADILGRNVSMLMPAPYQQAHDGYLQRHLATGHTSIIGAGREVQVLHKNGEVIDVRLAVGRANMAERPMFVGFLTDIRQRKAMERSLQQSEEQHRTLIDNIPGVTFRRLPHALWQPLFLSAAVETLTGWSTQELLGNRQRMEQLLLDEDIAALHRSVSDALANDVPYTHEFRLRHRDGSVRWVSESGRGVYDAQGQLQWIDGVLIDHTEVKARNAEFEGTVAAINRAVAVVEYSMDGHVLSANENFLQLFGYTLNDVKGQYGRMFSLDTPQALARDMALWSRLQRGEHVSIECQVRAKGNRVLWVQATFSPILDASGKPLRITQLITDITASRTLAQALEEAKNKAEAAAAARSTFLANMSHEIRTPMNAIIGFSEALLDMDLQASQHRYVETVHRSARSMLRLLNDILDTAKLDKGAVHLEEHDFSIAEVCQLVTNAQRIQAQQKGLQLLLEIAPDMPSYLRGDALRVQQIITNLMGNAVKFTERGHVRLYVRYAHQHLHLHIQDTGIGIAPDKLEHIFDPFAQADASTTRRFGGTGLGTTISRQLVQLMQGSIHVNSHVGVGTEFHVQLPLPVGRAPKHTAEHVPVRLPALHILCVDDVPQNLELLQVVMQRHGHRVTLAHNGAEAVQLRQNTRFDLVLMDLQMPLMDGLQASCAIRSWEAQEGQTRVPIIALSASVLEQDRVASDAAGMDGFATKPIEQAKLFEEIARVLQHTSAAAKPSSELQRPVASLSASAPDDAAHTPSTDCIDWQAGLQLWGDEHQLQAAWQRFMQEYAEHTSSLEALVQRADWDSTAATVHRMRGAAGNLGLRQLHAILGDMENAARQANGQELTQQLPALAQALEHVQGLLAPTHGKHQPAPESMGESDAVAALSPAAQAQALEALQALKQALQIGEIDALSLEHLHQLLPPHQLQALQDALDVFDFDHALQCVQTLEPLLATTATHERNTSHAARH